ncbi:MAG TPA: rhomboid family intramembrane serine protease [Candidatus Acidoferrales bacterium]
MPLPPRWKWKLDRLRESVRGMFGSKKEEERRPRLCPSCGTLVGTTATKCHECGASVTFSIAAASRTLSSLMPATSPVTYIVMGINAFLFGVTMLASLQATGGASGFFDVDGQVLLRLGARQSILILRADEYWRLVMPIFLHGGLMHFLFNSMVLMNVGPQVEENYGSPRYLFIYIFTGILSFVVSVAWNVFSSGGYGLSIGASGSLMGLIGIMLAISKRRGGAMMDMLRGSLIRWLVLIFILGFFFRADHAAHIGGLAAGYVLGMVMADREPMNAAERNRAYLLGWLAGLTVAVSMAFMLVQYFRGA